jgi:hypothetical protein
MTQSINVIVPAPIVVHVSSNQGGSVIPDPVIVAVGTGQGGAVGPQGLQGTQGIPGQPGTVGIQGVQGIAGATTVPSIAYTHTQMGVASIWFVVHNLGFYPTVTVIDSGGSIVEGEITYTSLNTLTLTFTAGFSGSAYLS